MTPNDNEVKKLLNFYHTALSDKLKKLTLPLNTFYGFDTFSYKWISSEGNYFDISNQPSIAEFYLLNRLYQTSPFISHPDNFNNGVYLSSAFEGCSQFQNALKENSHIQVADGIIISKKKENCVHVFTIGTTNPKHPVASIALNNLNILDKFCDYFLDQWKPNFMTMRPYILNVATLVGKEAFHKKKTFYYGTELNRKIDFLKSIGILDEDSFYLLNLTNREKECLSFMIEGKSMKETSEILHISPRTVESHILHIKNKLNCKSKIEILHKFETLKLLGLL